MTSHLHYVPILKAKEAEMSSLRELSGDVRKHLTPLFEIPPVPWDFVNDVEAKTIGEHLGQLPQKLASASTPGSRTFIDAGALPDAVLMADGRHPLSFVIDEARRLDLQLVPVTSPTRPPAYQAAVRDAVARDGLGVCVRLTDDDLENSSRVESLLGELSSAIEVSVREFDVVIDFGSIDENHTNRETSAAISILADLPYAGELRSLTFAASSFPPNLSGFSADSVNEIERAEWAVWAAIQKRQGSIPRLPAFGDYAVQHPEQVEIDPRVMQMSVNLRYTIDRSWLILKGRNLRSYGHEQFNALCRTLVALPQYYGRGFSWGDTYIHACANELDGPGNATTWRKVGTTHHLTVVSRQIASLAAA